MTKQQLTQVLKRERECERESEREGKVKEEKERRLLFTPDDAHLQRRSKKNEYR